jgi:hypothetical protein
LHLCAADVFNRVATNKPGWRVPLGGVRAFIYTDNVEQAKAACEEDNNVR